MDRTINQLPVQEHCYDCSLEDSGEQLLVHKIQNAIIASVDVVVVQLVR
jgi:hypothetical protein